MRVSLHLPRLSQAPRLIYSPVLYCMYSTYYTVQLAGGEGGSIYRPSCHRYKRYPSRVASHVQHPLPGAPQPAALGWAGGAFGMWLGLVALEPPPRPGGGGCTPAKYLYAVKPPSIARDVFHGLSWQSKALQTDAPVPANMGSMHEERLPPGTVLLVSRE